MVSLPLMKQVVNAFGIPFVFYPADAAPATQLSRITDCWNAARARMRVEGLKELILVLNTNANSQHAALPGFAMLIQRASLREPSRGGGRAPARGTARGTAKGTMRAAVRVFMRSTLRAAVSVFAGGTMRATVKVFARTSVGANNCLSGRGVFTPGRFCLEAYR